MRTVGVDLAAGPEKTALAEIEWSGGGALLQRLRLGADDDLIVDAVTGSEKLGIGCPLGWPLPFVKFIASHRDGHVVIPQDVAGRDWRRKLAFRTTDEVTRRTTGLIPLSVAADRIGHTAMRCAGLLARLAADGCVVDRRGQGIVVEVYPSASLKRWDLPHRGYKGAANAASLNALVDELITAAPWLVLGEHETLCRQSDDALDAVIAALTARAARLGLVTTPSTADKRCRCHRGLDRPAELRAVSAHRQISELGADSGVLDRPPSGQKRTSHTVV